ncbi:ABC transporter permease [Sutterella sp.]|uniref:ABC transporter permease n=1 Tax=Sutterella sp. TaxID=1981025 RepID=UPI0026DEB972|nr:ABC transporter permease [Sutterella sp.]MDO5531790.1 ABC transporter permease [Sutterella sp.]
MSSVAARRWRTFKGNRRAYFAFLLFAFCFVVSLFAEVLCNDRPVVLRAHGEWFAPVFQTVTEKDLGGDLELAADFSDEYTLELMGEDAFALWPPVRHSFRSIARDVERFPAPPSASNWLGTDDQGRDILARLVYGFRLSVLFGLSLAAVSSVIGIAAGLVQGWYGGWVDLVAQRLMEIWSGMPVLYLIIILSSLFAMNFWLLLAIMLLFGWMRLVGLVRAETLRVRNLDYVRAARALGCSDARIMRVHVLPNALVSVIAALPFVVNGSIATLTSLDFLGFGLPADYPSLGEIIAQGKNNLYAPWIGLSGFLTLAGLLVSLVFIGEGMRDAFDPRVFLAESADGTERKEEAR